MKWECRSVGFVSADAPLRAPAMPPQQVDASLPKPALKIPSPCPLGDEGPVAAALGSRAAANVITDEARTVAKPRERRDLLRIAGTLERAAMRARDRPILRRGRLKVTALLVSPT